jgi:hypothetical protein
VMTLHVCQKSVNKKEKESTRPSAVVVILKKHTLGFVCCYARRNKTGSQLVASRQCLKLAAASAVRKSSNCPPRTPLIYPSISMLPTRASTLLNR